MATKNNSFIEAYIINNSAKFQLYTPYGFSGVDLLNILFCKFNISAAMVMKQIERFGLK